MDNNSIHQRVIKQKPILNIQTKDNKAQRKLIEEIDSLKLIYTDKVIGIPAEFGYIKAIQITVLPDQIKSENEALANVVLGVHFPQEYPNHVPKIDFIQTEGFTIQEQESLFQELFDTALNSSGDAMIYGIVVKCQQVVTSQHDKHYQNKISTRNLYDIFMQDEKDRLKESKKKNKLDEKENNKEGQDEQQLRMKWLEQREKDIPEYEEYEFSNTKKSPKVQAWQLLNNQEILLIHLLKIVMKYTNNKNTKQLGELLKIFEITTKKELIKLISPKYEVLFNNLLISKFDKFIKKEQENIDQRQAELLAKKIHDKNLIDRIQLMNQFFCNSFSSSGNIKPILEEKQQQSPSQQQQNCCSQQQNRLQTDFEIVQTLGKGAFGEVFKAKNKIDGRFYAIKKIKVPYGAALNRILREVDLLSRLHHRHVIRYYQAWIDESDDQGEELYISDEESDIQIGSGFTVNNSSHYKFNSHQSNSVLSNNQFISSNMRDKKVLVLFIQTEYCTKTLRKQIDEVYPTVNDPGFIWNQFRQILEAMVYTHQQKIIHRDLKPENIFLDVTGDIKIGDFGLAKHTSKQTHNVMYTASVDDQEEIPEILNYISSVSKIEEQDMKLLDRTLNVGTYFYCPTNNKEFDEKRDIYALGVILLEMWHPFQNQRERMKILNNLKQSGKLPKKFTDSHPRQSNLIKWMINADPHERPTIQEILHSEFIPPKVEDEYFKEAIKVLGTSSNESIYYQRLMSALFQNKRLCYIDRDRMFLRKELNVRQFYIPQIHQFMLQQCILQIETPFLIDRPKHYNQFIQPLVQMMNYSGETVILRNHLRNSFEKYLQNMNNKLLQNKVMKCYEIGQIYEKQGSQILVQNELSYDQIIMNDNGLLSNLITSIQFLINIGIKPIKIRLNYEPLIQELLVGIQIYDKINQRKVFDYMTHTVQLNGSLNTLKLKQFILNDTITFNAKFIHDVYVDKIDKLIQIFTFKSVINQINIQEQFKYNFSDNGNNIIKDLVDIQTNFDKIFQIIRKNKETQGLIIPNIKLHYDAQINNKQFGFRNGYHFSIDVQEFNQPILNGGSYKKGFKKLQTICSVLIDAPTKIEINPNYFGGVQRSTSQCLNPKLELPLSRIQSDTFSQGIHISQICKQKIEIQGFSVNLENIDEIFSLKYPKILFKYQVLICSMGSNLAGAKREFQQQCQINEISCLLYNDEDYCQFEEYVSFADKNDIKLIVLLKDKLYHTKNKAFVRYKKDKNTKVDKEFSLEEFTTFLQKHILK